MNISGDKEISMFVSPIQCELYAISVRFSYINAKMK